nr:asparagine synthase-related protein [Kineococcus aurantiacus]
MPVGAQPGVRPLPPGSGLTLRAALEEAVLPALRRGPCVVSFSGGRDSSTVLAVATSVARREGLPDPVPYTHRFPHVPDSHEDEWAELVVRHLGLREWERPAWGDEMDVLGPFARTVLLRDGVLPPFNGHLHEPVFAAARGGSVLTGIGGDELFSQVSRYPAVRLLARRAPLTARALPRTAFSVLAPAPLRARRLGRHLPMAFGWLRPDAARELRAAVARHTAAEPLRWDRAARRWLWTSRLLHVAGAAKERTAAAHDVHVTHPFSRPATLRAAAVAFGWAGPRGRTGELLRHVGDLLPRALCERGTKAGFNGAFWTATAASFAARWTGVGVDTDLVDPEALRAEWAAPDPDLHSITLLQHAWLAQEGRPAR